MQSRIMLYS